MAPERFQEYRVPGSDACILIGDAPSRPPLEGGSDIHADVAALGGPWRTVLWIASTVTPSGESLTTVPIITRAMAPEVTFLHLGETSRADIENAIESFFARTPKHLPSILLSRSHSAEHSELYLAAVDAAIASTEAHNRARITRQRDAFAWQEYIFRNLPDYAARRLPVEWAGALAGLPAFVCGAGPSLDASIHALAASAPGAIIFAADSSLRALEKAGVHADFAVSVDVAKEPARCLADSARPSRVVLSANSPPAWQDAIPAADRFYVSSNQLTLDWLAAQGIPRTGPAVCENCGATAIEIARYLGCAPIHLFGMDLALAENTDAAPAQRHHGEVGAINYSNSGFNPQGEFPRVPGNFAPTVPTHVLGDWRALDQRLAELPAGLVWVITDRGAKLANTTIVRPEAFAALPPLDKAARVARLAPAQPASQAACKAVSTKLASFATDLLAWIPSIRTALATAGPEALAASLRSLFADPEHGQILGAFSLKLMPHLLPPIDPAADWAALISELESVATDAAQSAFALLAFPQKNLPSP